MTRACDSHDRSFMQARCCSLVTVANDDAVWLKEPHQRIINNRLLHCHTIVTCPDLLMFTFHRPWHPQVHHVAATAASSDRPSGDMVRRCLRPHESRASPVCNPPARRSGGSRWRSCPDSILAQTPKPCCLFVSGGGGGGLLILGTNVQ